MNFTSKEISLLSDTEFFAAKAHVSPKIRDLLERIHESFQRELKAHHLLVPDAFDPEARQFVKGEHLEDFPYQYLDYPRFFTRDVKFSFRSLVWWGHHMVFALILEGGHLRRYKENLINRFSSIADRDIQPLSEPFSMGVETGPRLHAEPHPGAILRSGGRVSQPALFQAGAICSVYRSRRPER